MDFLDPKKKKAHLIRLYIGYFLMAVALSIGTLILLFEVSGYDYDRKTGTVIQNGLVFVDAHPEQATIFLNGKQEGQTDTRLTLPANSYDFELRRDGYRTWRRTLQLEGGSIERMVYPFLFPEKLEPKDIRSYDSSPGLATQSPDRKWLLVQKPGSLTTFDVIDLGNDANTTTTLTLPNNLFSAGAGEHKLEMVEWSTDNRHVLLKHTFGTNIEFVMVDREQPTTSFNINKTFNLAPSEVALRDKKFDQFHLLEKNGGILRHGDSKSGQLDLLANRVLAFKSYGDDTLVYITEESAPAGKTLVYARRGNDTYKLRELPKGDINVVDISRFDDKWFIAAGTNAENKAYIYKEPFEALNQQKNRALAPIAVLKLEKLEYVSISANSRFIGAQGGSTFAVYDAEHDRTYTYDTKLVLTPGYKARWMDGHRYMAVSEGQVAVFDFDGTNIQKLTPSDVAFLPFFDRDYDFLYTIGPSVACQTKPGVLKASMRIPSDQ
jgi:hypothetical protein